MRQQTRRMNPNAIDPLTHNRRVALRKELGRVPNVLDEVIAEFFALAKIVHRRRMVEIAAANSEDDAEDYVLGGVNPDGY